MTEFIKVLFFFGVVIAAFIMGMRQERVNIRERSLIEYKYCYTNKDLEILIFDDE